MATDRADHSTVPLHLVANVAGRLWVLLANFAFVPIYLHLLGLENFGVVALFTAVSGIIAFLDLGLSPTLSRELHDQRSGPRERADLLYTYEVVYTAVVGAVIVLAFVVPEAAFSAFLSPTDLARPQVAGSVRLVFAAAAAQMLLNFYVAGLLGIEQQVRANALLVSSGVVRSALVVVPLWLAPTPRTYLLWQLGSSIAFALLGRTILYFSIGAGRGTPRPAFSRLTLSRHAGFSGAMFLGAVTAAVNTQVDKVFLARLAGLETLAAYSLACTFAQLIVFVVSPVTMTLLPRFVRAATAGDDATVRELFTVSHRLVAGVVSAMVGAMVVFGPYLIGLWTGGQVDPGSVSGYLPALVCGYALLALGTVPHNVAVANKNLQGSVVISASVLVTVPAYWFLVRRNGATGAAMAWLVLQSLVVPGYYVWVWRRFLGIPRPMQFLVRTVAAPVAVSAGISLAASHVLTVGGPVGINLVVIAFAAMASTAGCALLTLRPSDRAFLLGSPVR